MATAFPPTPEERLSGSFSEVSPAERQKPVAVVTRNSALPTPNSPVRDSFSSQSDGPEQQVRDPVVVPLDDEMTDARPLFNDNQLDEPAQSQEKQQASSRSSTPVDSFGTGASTPESSSRVDVVAEDVSPPVHGRSHAASPIEKKGTLLPAKIAYKSPTVTVPGTTIVLRNTVDAVLAYYRNNLQEIQGLQKAQREAREPSASASADSFTRHQVNALNKIPALPTRKRKVSATVATDNITLDPSTKRQRLPTVRNPSTPPAPRKLAATVAPKPKKTSTTPRARASSTFSDQSPQAVKHQRSGPQKKALWPELKMGEWREAENYCPPIDMDKPIGLKAPPAITTGTNSKRTPAPFTDAEIDKTDIDELHPEEVVLAKDFRVEPQAYLITKRRIFAARVRALVDNQNWNKTCAQQSVQMDVNKASRFFLAYDAVGWFDEEHFPEGVQRRWMENEKKRRQKA